jgi:hypothetical protein
MRRWGLLGSLGNVGDCFDNARHGFVLGTDTVELLNTRRWATTIEFRRRHGRLHLACSP